ncbi:MurR/RpiR family transcriptional regulator [Terribacillus sp. JSM ZJ617]|uniref:MurR/RpiR family transcriptional regulator n=1 Tax=Terribacillus sp. JSM ZJ617 TaxID=3342119 RepID=UPI0035A8D29A
MNIIGKLMTMRDFTPTEKTIAAYILEHKEEVIHLNVQQLAKVVYTSHSAIIRLIQKLGLKGYKEFIVGLAQELQITVAHSEIDINYPFNSTAPVLQLANDMADLMSSTVEKTFNYLRQEDLENAVQMLSSANRIYIYAFGDSQIRAASFQNKMLKIDKHVIIATQLAEWAYHTQNSDKSDCAIILSYHGMSDTFAKAAAYLHAQETPILVITSDERGELTKWGTTNLIVPNSEEKFAKIGTFSSQLSFEYILNVLYACLFQENYEVNVAKALDADRFF